MSRGDRRLRARDAGDPRGLRLRLHPPGLHLQPPRAGAVLHGERTLAGLVIGGRRMGDRWSDLLGEASRLVAGGELSAAKGAFDRLEAETASYRADGAVSLSS